MWDLPVLNAAKPHIANHPLHAAAFAARGYGIGSCYNALPLAGGASALTRVNLPEVAKRARDTDGFLANTPPQYVTLNFRLTQTRTDHGHELDPVSHVQALAPHHQYCPSSISEVLTLDATVKANPDAVLDLCKGALACGLREFTANVGGNDLVRVTGHMIRLSDVARYNTDKGARTNTTALGADAAKLTAILAREPRMVARELSAGADQ